MAKSLLKQLVRNFPENGPKLLLENSANVRELLIVLDEKKVDAIEFAAMTVERTHFVQPDYAHVAVDLLLKAPMRVGAGDALQTVFIYLLIEHQSNPQRFIMLRLAEYLLEAYKMQKKAWDKLHDSDAKLLLQPMLPIVLYTGERHWEKIEPLANVVELGALFADVIPLFKPHFLNLRDTPAESLLQKGGFFGQVLWLIQQRNVEPATFRRTLAEVVSRLEELPPSDRTRWVEFLSCILALVYHARGVEEHKELRDEVDRSVQSDPNRKEFTKMSRTIAESLKDEGRLEGRLEGQAEARTQGKQQEALDSRRAILLRQLRRRFKKVPRKVEARIAATTSIRDMESWLDNIVDATTLADVGIPLD